MVWLASLLNVALYRKLKHMPVRSKSDLPNNTFGDLGLRYGPGHGIHRTPTGLLSEKKCSTFGTRKTEISIDETRWKCNSS